MKVASQAKQRKVAKALTGDDIQVEEAPFCFQIRDKKGHYEVKDKLMLMFLHTYLAISTLWMKVVNIA